jgi:hypothetical protein
LEKLRKLYVQNFKSELKKWMYSFSMTEIRKYHENGHRMVQKADIGQNREIGILALRREMRFLRFYPNI